MVRNTTKNTSENTTQNTSRIEHCPEYNRIRDRIQQNTRDELALQSWTDIPLVPTNLLWILNLSQQIINVNFFQNVVDRQHDADVLEALARRAGQGGRVIKAKGHTILRLLVLIRGAYNQGPSGFISPYWVQIICVHA